MSSFVTLIPDGYELRSNSQATLRPVVVVIAAIRSTITSWQDSARRLSPLSSFSLPASQRTGHITLWQVGPGGKTPYYFQLKDGSPFAFAGLWERWVRCDS